jgi:hypothetical protein
MKIQMIKAASSAPTIAPPNAIPTNSPVGVLDVRLLVGTELFDGVVELAPIEPNVDAVPER